MLDPSYSSFPSSFLNIFDLLLKINVLLKTHKEDILINFSYKVNIIYYNLTRKHNIMTLP